MKNKNQKKEEFATVNVLPGKTNACVKNLMKQMGITDANEAVRRINSGEWIAQPNIRLIDCNTAPFVPENWSVEQHIKGGLITFDSTKITLWLSDQQKNGRVTGYELRQELTNKPVLNANVLDYLLAHQKEIPEEWKNQYTFFWSTIYRDSDGDVVVRCLVWDGSQWRWGFSWLDIDFGSDRPAALAS